jgi:hypothetical protein
MRDGGQAPCRRVRTIAETKLKQVKRQIQDLIAMRDQLDRILKGWKTKLAHTRKGEPAGLLEGLPQEFAIGALSSPMKKTRKKTTV